MILTPRKGFNKVILILDKINPFIVILSVIGLILEYTSFHSRVSLPNKMMDVIFVFDFILRASAFPFKKYFFKSYGWVDLLASIPGFTVLLEGVPGFFTIFKVLRVGRFFKILRVLRFLRIFSFLKKMKADSPYVQDRLMKIGIVVVLVMVCAIGTVDVMLDHYESRDFAREVERLNAHTGSYEKTLSLIDQDVIEATHYKNDFFDAAGQKITEHDFWMMANTENRILVKLSSDVRYVLHDTVYLSFKNSVMLGLIISLIVLILLNIFYIGFVLAADMKWVNLIVDSLDADDTMLLLEEGRKFKNTSGRFEIEEGEDEIISLFKMVCKTSEERGSGFGSINLTPSTDLKTAVEESLYEDNEDISFKPDEDDREEDHSKGSKNEVSQELLRLREFIREENQRLKEEMIKEILASNQYNAHEIAVKSVRYSAKSVTDYIKTKFKKD